MLKYINLLKIRKLQYFFLTILFTYQTADARNTTAEYEITWNGIHLGNITWQYIIDLNKYEFIIELKNKGLTKLYPFYGKYFSEGLIVNDEFKPSAYSQVWQTKKKNHLIEILFKNNKIDNIRLSPEEKSSPKFDFYSLKNPVDPISGALELIIYQKKTVIKNIFDGRRVYNFSTINNKEVNFYENFTDIKNYELNVSNYKNIWKDHNKKDLKKIKIITGKEKSGYVLPLKFIIFNKGFVFKINYIKHITTN